MVKRSADNGSDPAQPSPVGSLPLPDECVLVLQGGGALGAYQGGVYEALTEAGISLDWVAGISIGAVNAALIAGNPPERRIERLREFWETASSQLPEFPLWAEPHLRALVNEASAAWVAMAGVPGMFAPRWLPPLLAPSGSVGANSFYDTTPLRETLERLVDFDLLNNGPIRLSVGAVNVKTGNFIYFDTRERRIGPEHIMASGALPPGLPPVEIDGEYYWDGGIVSNTPLQHVLDNQGREDMLVFQVDLFPAEGELPRNVVDCVAREKEIRYSSRTRMNTDAALALRRAKTAVRDLIAKLPADLADDPEVAFLRKVAVESAVNVVQLIHRGQHWEGGSRDYEFSRRTMEDHWRAGRADVHRTMEQKALIARNIVDGATAAFDLTRSSSGE